MSYRRRKRRKKGLLDDTATKWTLLISLFVVSLFIVVPFTQSVYVGGWAIQPSFVTLTQDGVDFEIDGLKSNVYDTDGNFIPAQIFLDAIGETPAIEFVKCGISVEIDDVYYLNSAGYYSDKAEVITTYDVDISDTEIVRYNLYNLAYDITIKTDADKYDKPLGVYDDYGWFFENGVVEVSVLTDFYINPWTPTGSEDNWNVVGGWAGILSASINSVDYGLIQTDADENYGHVIQNPHSVGANLNTYIDETDSGTYNFNDVNALVGVPSRVQIETSVKVGAGADYTEFLGHWTSVSVRNVFVKYTVLVEIATSMEFEFQLSPTEPMDTPDEDNTNYAPELTIPFLSDLFDMFGEGLVTKVILGAIVVVGLFITIKIVTRKKQQQIIYMRPNGT